MQLLATVESSKGNGQFYQVSRLNSGALICNCPGYGYRHTCRHTVEVRATLPPQPPVSLHATRSDNTTACEAGHHLFTWAFSGAVRRCWWCYVDEETQA